MPRTPSASRRLGPLLALSLALNVFGFIAWRLDLRGSGEPEAESRQAGPRGPVAAGAAGRSASDAPIAAAGAEAPPIEVAAKDLPRAVRDALRAAGVKDSVARRLVEQVVWDRHSTTEPRPWWQASAMGSGFSTPSPATFKAVGAELSALFPESPGLGGRSDPRLDVLSEEKRRAVERVLRDYADMSGVIHAEMMAFQMPEDQERLALLKAERDQDLAALLTPEEYAEVTLLESPAGQRAQFIAQQLDLTEAEFRAVVRLRQEADARMAGASPSTPGQHAAEEARFQRELANLLGEERVHTRGLSGSQDAKLLEKARMRLGFSDEVFEQVLAQRLRVDATVTQVVASSAPVAEKRAALRREAAAVKAEVARLLGPRGAEAYFLQNGMYWLSDLERGRGIRFDPPGAFESFEVR
jgi:hypothetical protein